MSEVQYSNKKNINVVTVTVSLSHSCLVDRLVYLTLSFHVFLLLGMLVRRAWLSVDVKIFCVVCKCYICLGGELQTVLVAAGGGGGGKDGGRRAARPASRPKWRDPWNRWPTQLLSRLCLLSRVLPLLPMPQNFSMLSWVFALCPQGVRAWGEGRECSKVM